MEKEHGVETQEYRKLSRKLNFLKHQLKMSNKKISNLIPDCTVIQISDTIMHGKKALPYDRLKELMDLLESKHTEFKVSEAAAKFDYEKLSLERDKKIVIHIKEYLNKNNMTVKQFQKKVDISPATFSRFISGQVRFSRKSLDDCRSICEGIGKKIEDYIIMDTTLDVDDIISTNFSDLVKEVASKRNITKSSFIEKHHIDLYYFRINPLGSQALYKTEIVQNALHFDFLHPIYFEDRSISKEENKPKYGVAYVCKCGYVHSTTWNSIACSLCNTRNTFINGQYISEALAELTSLPAEDLSIDTSMKIREDDVFRHYNGPEFPSIPVIMPNNSELVNSIHEACESQVEPEIKKSKYDCRQTMGDLLDNEDKYKLESAILKTMNCFESPFEKIKSRPTVSMNLDYELYKKIKPLQDIINICKENHIKLNYNISVNATI